MPRRPKNISAEDKKDILDFSRRISSAVESYCRLRGIKISRLSKDMGYNQASLRNLIRSPRPNQGWTTDMLLMVARTLGIPLSRIVRAAETGAPLTREAIPLDKRIAALEEELAILRKKQRRQSISQMMRELSDQWSALKIEAEQLDKECDPFSAGEGGAE